MTIRILVTGGTFDKEYDERTGQLFFKDTHVAEMLGLGRCRVEVTIRTVMLMDSLEMTEADRALIAHNCAQAHEDRILITHGTDTMVETAAAIADAISGKDSCINRSNDPVCVWQLRWSFQSRECIVLRASIACRCLHCDERKMVSVEPG